MNNRITPNTIETTIAVAVADEVALALDERLTAIESQLAELAKGPRPERLLTKAQIADHVGCSTRTIDTLAGQGLPHMRLGGPGGVPRYLASAVTAWLASR